MNNVLDRPIAENLISFYQKIEMKPAEKEYVQAMISGKNSFLEIGSGSSTIWFSQFVNRMVSVETEKIWYDRITYLLAQNNINNVQLEYFPPESSAYTPEGKESRVSNGRRDYGRSEEYKSYLEKIENLIENEFFDVILVDGKVRPQIVELLAKKNYKGLVLLHDFREDRIEMNKPIYSMDNIEIINQIESLAVIKVVPKRTISQSNNQNNGQMLKMLTEAIGFFNEKIYANLFIILNDLEHNYLNIGKRFKNFHLLKSFACWSMNLADKALKEANKEVALHNNDAARLFIAEVIQPSKQVDCLEWCKEKSAKYDMTLAEVKAPSAVPASPARAALPELETSLPRTSISSKEFTNFMNMSFYNLWRWQIDDSFQSIFKSITLYNDSFFNFASKEIHLICISSYLEENDYLRSKYLLDKYIAKFGLADIENYLIVADFAHSIGISNPMISKSSKLYKTFDKSSRSNEAVEYIKNKSVAIVGNSPSLIGKNLGQEIDSHDVVIRFNHFKLGEYLTDTGSKTDVWFRTMHVPHRPELQNCKVLLSEDYLHDRVLTRAIDALIAVSDNIISLGWQYLKALRKDSKIINPSSGMKMIYYLYKHKSILSKLSIYGFTFNAGQELKPENFRNQYFSEDNEYKPNSLTHNYNAESRFINQLMQEK